MSLPKCSRQTSLSRRTFLTSAGCAAILAISRDGLTRGRTPLGGRFSVHVPWPTRSIDPHDLRDPTAALFAKAIVDSLFDYDTKSLPMPALAAGLPTAEAVGTVVRLRPGLLTARKVSLDGRDVIASVERARARGAIALLGDIPKPTPYPNDPLAVVFGKTDPGHLARVLASPLLAIVPKTFRADAPDGTGPFRADCADRELILSRNPHSALGHAFLDGIDVWRADDLATSLRRFEAERDDVGWLGLGLHGERKGASRFDLGPLSWIVLWLNPGIAAPAGLPGTMQQLLDAIPKERISHLGLGGFSSTEGLPVPAWPGPSLELLVDEEAAHLVEIARTIAPILSRPGHEITVVTLPRAEITSRRAKGQVQMSMDVVRPLLPGPLGALLSLSTADDATSAKELAKKPPKLAPQAGVRTLTRSLHVGVVGELRVTGGKMPELMLAQGGMGWDLGGSFMVRRRGK